MPKFSLAFDPVDDSKVSRRREHLSLIKIVVHHIQIQNKDEAQKLEENIKWNKQIIDWNKRIDHFLI